MPWSGWHWHLNSTADITWLREVMRFVNRWRMPLIFLVASLPIFYMGWGGREAIVIVTLGSVAHLPTSESLALSAAYGVVVFLASLPGAALWLMRPSMRKR